MRRKWWHLDRKPALSAMKPLWLATSVTLHRPRDLLSLCTQPHSHTVTLLMSPASAEQCSCCQCQSQCFINLISVTGSDEKAASKTTMACISHVQHEIVTVTAMQQSTCLNFSLASSLAPIPLQNKKRLELSHLAEKTPRPRQHLHISFTLSLYL